MNIGACKNESFRKRIGNFAIRIHSNGRTTVLPKRAIDAEIQKVSIKESLSVLFEERARLTSERNKHPQNSEEWLRLDQTLNRVRGNLGNVERQLREARSKEFCEVFQFCAEQLLTHEAYLMIREATHMLMGKHTTINNRDA